MKHKAAIGALMLALLMTLAVCAQARVEIYDIKASAYVPAFIDYRLNCPADVSISILPSDAGGTPTGPAIKTITFLGQTRGFHRYIWLADMDVGGSAPVGYYVAELSATSNQAQWDPIIGLYTMDNWTTESAARPLPTVPDTEGFYGVAVNNNPASPTYGRIYATHKVQKDIFMYRPDGSYLGKFDDSPITWQASAPWDIAVADDGFVYVCDRSSMLVHCFDADGIYKSTSPTTTNHRAIFARTTSDGVTHIVYSGSTSIKKITVQADHVTWQTYPFGGNTLFDPLSSTEQEFGMWANPTMTTIYQACLGGTGAGVTKWNLVGGIWTKETTPFVQRITSAADVSFVDDATDFLWITRQVGYLDDSPTTTQNETSRALYKTNAATNATITYLPYDIITWGLMNCADGVGNPAICFGKSTATWAQRYWGLFAEAEAGPFTCATKRTTAFYLGPTPSPVVVPGSSVWTPDNTIAATDSDTASVSFKVMDVNGWADITSVVLDLQPLGYGSAVACTLSQDFGDPGNQTAIATLSGIKAKVGTRCSTSNGQPPHYLTASPLDTTNGGYPDAEEVQINVTGDPSFDAYVKHRRVTGWDIDGAYIVSVGGGIPGATDPRAAGPFTYRSTPTVGGYASLEMSAGSFGVIAEKKGFGSETAVSVTIPYTGYTMNLYLRPLTIAEARATGNDTFVNVEGVCYAQPEGLAPTAAYGLDQRTDTMVKRNQWYVCDANSPANGMLFMVTAPSDVFILQWDDVNLTDDFGNSLYIGKRPAVGETIMITGLLGTPGGHERRVLLQNSDVEAAMGAIPSTIQRVYYNRGNLGGLPGTPVSMTIPGIYHSIAQGFAESWGKFGRVTGATVLAYQADGVEAGVGMTDPVPYYTIADVAGNTAQIAIDMPATLNITTIIPNGSTYTFTGAASRRTRNGQGAIRPRGESDMVQESAPPPAPDPLSVIRAGIDGDPVNISGICVHKAGTSMWLEAADRSIGIRVRKNYSWVALGDMVQVVGNLDLYDGEMTIVPTVPALVLSKGNVQPAPLDMRSREIGGVGSGTTPGVDSGRGALNVGLKVHFLGMVTAVEPVIAPATPTWYYLWDGANRSDLPTSDGSGYIGIHIEAAPPSGVVPWTNWVDVTGVVGTDSNFVTGAIIPTILPITHTKVTAFDTITATTGTALTAQWNLMSVVAAPAADSDGDEWTPKPFGPEFALGPNRDAGDIDNRMYRWENCSGGLYIWDMWSEMGTHGPFGGLLLGDGYWLQLDTDWAVNYSGKNSSLDQWLGVCATGWMITGQPKDHSTYLADVKVHDGAKVWTMYEAIIDNAWIDCVGYWWDNQNQGLVDVGIPDCWASTDALVPWHGYWIQSYRGDLALIVPESPAVP